ncbi:MAG: zf-HC2 domain-containing protein [Coriobacteriia bacterium]
MSRQPMTCEHCANEIEAYIAGDLDESGARQVAFHLAECENCATAYAEHRDLIARLRAVPSQLEPARTAEVMAAARPSAQPIVWWQTAAAVAAGLAMLSVSALTLPAFASQIPVLPTTQRLQALEAEREQLETRNESLHEQIEQLEIQIKDIDGEAVPVVDTAPGQVAPEVTEAVQLVVMNFIRAQYRGDAATLKALATNRLAEEIDARPDEYLKAGEVVFAQMTTVSEAEDGTLLVFVRLSDEQFSDSTYQENFEVKRQGDGYVVDFVGMDA